MLSFLRQSSQSLFSLVLTTLLLACLVLNCFQMSAAFASSVAEGQMNSAMHNSAGSSMAHDCCEPDSSHCPLEIPLVKLFFSADAPQFFQLFWVLPLAVSLLALSLLRQLLYRLSPLPVWRSYLPSYPRLHVQQEVFLN